MNQEHLAKDVSKLYTECFQPVKVPPRRAIKSKVDTPETAASVTTASQAGTREWVNAKLIYLEQLRRGEAMLFKLPAAGHAAPKRENAFKSTNPCAANGCEKAPSASSGAVDQSALLRMRKYTRVSGYY